LYELLVADVIAAQFAPTESQSCHWYVNVMGVDPAHDPVDAVSNCPTTAEPDIAGRLVFVGVVALPGTSAVGDDTADAKPTLLDAVTCTLNVWPWSALTTRYELLVADEIATQLEPAELQSCHWYPNVIGVDPDHDPVEAVNTCPTSAEPEIAGGPVLAGAVNGQSSVEALTDDWSDLFPAASYASIAIVWVVAQKRPEKTKFVSAVWPTSEPSRNMS
jgi:hypothetical protein